MVIANNKCIKLKKRENIHEIPIFAKYKFSIL